MPITSEPQTLNTMSADSFVDVAVADKFNGATPYAHLRSSLMLRIVSKY